MRCWRCGQDVPAGSSVCVACGASQNRPKPTTEAGQAMRDLYDHYGADEVFSNPAYLTNGLDDLLPDSATLRQRLARALDAGVGREYLDQIGSQGASDTAFSGRVHTLLTGDAGLTDNETNELQRLLDEMVGWPTAKHKQKTNKNHVQTQTKKKPKPSEGPAKAPSAEVKHTDVSPVPLPLPSEPAPSWAVSRKLLTIGAGTLVAGLVPLLVGSFLTFAPLVFFAAPVALVGTALLGVIFIRMLLITGRFLGSVEGFSRDGSTVTYQWIPTKKGAQNVWYFAVDGQWRAAFPPERFTRGNDKRMHGSITLENVPLNSRLATCVRMKPNAKLTCITDAPIDM